MAGRCKASSSGGVRGTPTVRATSDWLFPWHSSREASPAIEWAFLLSDKPVGGAIVLWTLCLLPNDLRRRGVDVRQHAAITQVKCVEVPDGYGDEERRDGSPSST